MKRIFDTVLVVLLSPFWLPVFLLTAVTVLLCLGWPIFYCDRRAGLRGRPFTLLKFRTMKTGAGSDAERMTRLGSFLRRFSLDEVPELFNVLLGDMALVGPRPLPVRYLERYSPFEMRRHEVRPGITGWAQVNGRNALDWSEKFKLDVEYVGRRSLLFDLRILFMTVWTVLSARGISHGAEATMPELMPRGSAES
jgi:lipopolysaccharide/colanic/teichoic acid biosynthesis glycosyltransferase